MNTTGRNAMRLRQAHAILEASHALEATDLGIAMYPFDHDHPGSLNPHGDDYMTGFCEFTNEHGEQARVYNIDLIPGPSHDRITGRVTFGLGGGHELLHSEWNVSSPDEEGEQWRENVGAGLAERIAEEIRKYEKSVKAVFQEVTSVFNQ